MKQGNLLNLLQEDGFEVSRVTATEYAGACPWCGGEDRFRVWPGDRDRYWCRVCNRKGDAIQYLRDFRRLSFIQACKEANIHPRRAWRGLRHDSLVSKKNIWKPRSSKRPDDTWRKKAKRFLKYVMKELWSRQGLGLRTWLHSRGLSDKTIKKYMLGLNPSNLCKPRQEWGLPQGAGSGKLWLPRGLVIPCLQDSGIVRLRVRRMISEHKKRFILISGSSGMPMLFLGNGEKNFVIVESELDGLLLNQEVSDFASIVALGSVWAKPDKRTHQELSTARVILVALDADARGSQVFWKWWRVQYRNAIRWPVPIGKDPTEANQQGVNLRSWVEAGLSAKSTFDKQ